MSVLSAYWVRTDRCSIALLKRGVEVQTTYSLSHSDAQQIIAAIQERLEVDKAGAAVAVVDAHGELIAFLRTDGCLLPSITIAINKAFTAARQREATASVGQSSRDKGWPLTNYGDPRYVGWGGGVPLIDEGEVVGAVGVSGLPEDVDIELASLGVEAFHTLLETHMSKAELLARIERGWAKLQAFIAKLNEAQATGPTDAAGWTVKDHLMHLAVWEDSMNALLLRQSRPAHMGVPQEIWAGRDFDRINGVIQESHRDRTLADVLQHLETVHTALLEKLHALPEAELRSPHSAYQAGSDNAAPIIRWLTGDTYAHYAEHIRWMDAIVKGSA